MFRQRLLVAVILLPLGIFLINLGGLPYLFLILIFLGLAAWEYAGLFRAGGFRPSTPVMLAGVGAVLVGRYLNAGGDAFAWDSLILAFFVIAAMAVHLVDFERGARFSGTDFAITVSGGVYLGFLAGYLLPLRYRPDGLWWLLTVLPICWFADSGAYFLGKRFGKRPFSSRLSPKKTWEGYLGGILFGIGGGALMPLILQSFSETAIPPTPLNGAIIGLVLSIIIPFGDLGQSMIKRQVGIKDSSNLLPGHGGFFDRIDSWIWAVVIGYYLVSWVAG